MNGYEERMYFHGIGQADVAGAIKTEQARRDAGDRVEANRRGVTVEQLRCSRRNAGKPYDFSDWDNA